MSSLRCDSLLSTSDHLLDLLYGAIESTLNESIRRRCIQKNWRKLISIRHCRRRGEGTAEKDVKESRNETKQAQQTNNLEEERDTVDAAKKQLQTLEQLKLQELTDLKHVKFQLFKDILVEEAGSRRLEVGRRLL
ncbi:unnamed protein product [Peronospora effusa]|nr:unnamed protein product [Peronospora effusa]